MGLLQAHKRFGIAPKWNDKDYDLLSNKYHYGHEEYESQKRATALDKAAEKLEELKPALVSNPFATLFG